MPRNTTKKSTQTVANRASTKKFNLDGAYFGAAPIRKTICFLKQDEVSPSPVYESSTKLPAAFANYRVTWQQDGETLRLTLPAQFGGETVQDVFDAARQMGYEIPQARTTNLFVN